MLGVGSFFFLFFSSRFFALLELWTQTRAPDGEYFLNSTILFRVRRPAREPESGFLAVVRPRMSTAKIKNGTIYMSVNALTPDTKKYHYAALRTSIYVGGPKIQRTARRPIFVRVELDVWPPHGSTLVCELLHVSTQEEVKARGDSMPSKHKTEGDVQVSLEGGGVVEIMPFSHPKVKAWLKENESQTSDPSCLCFAIWISTAEDVRKMGPVLLQLRQKDDAGMWFVRTGALAPTTDRRHKDKGEVLMVQR